jgi:hypothetical protein
MSKISLLAPLLSTALFGCLESEPESGETMTETIGQGLSARAGQISSNEILSRAKAWYSLCGYNGNNPSSVPAGCTSNGMWYTTENSGDSDDHIDPEGTHSYRKDCSGFVSMALHLSQSYVTDTLPGVLDQIAIDSLQPGDVIDAVGYGSDGHTFLFEKWGDSAHTFYYAYDFGMTPIRHRTVQRSGSDLDLGDGRTFTAWHYPKNTGPQGSGRMDVFVEGTDNKLYHKWWDGTGWNPSETTFETLDGVMSSAPAAVSWGPDRIDVFHRGASNTLKHVYWEDDWQAGVSLGAEPMAGAPAVSSWGVDRLDVFFRGTDNALWHTYWNGSSWTPIASKGGTLASDPTAVSWGPDRIDVFYRGSSNTLSHKYWDGAAWIQGTGLGSPPGGLVGAPAVSSWGVDRLDVFVRGADNALWHRYWNGEQWSAWASKGGMITSDPAATSYAVDRIDVYYRGSGNTLNHMYWNGAAWVLGVNLGGVLTGAPAVTSGN